MKKRIFAAISAITLLSSLLMFAFGLLAVQISAENALEKSLKAETELVANLLNDQNDLIQIGKNSEYRITVIAEDGNVLWDTEASIAENHLDREEVQAAFADKPKIVKRYSQTVGSNMYYYAIKTNFTDGQTVVVRLAAKSTLVNEYFRVSLPVLVAVLLTVSILALIAGRHVANKFADQMKEIDKSLKSVVAGSYVPAKVDSRNAEFYYVVNSINDVVTEIYKHITSEQTERRKLGVVLESVSQGIVALNDKKEIVFINKNALSFFGNYNAADKLGSDKKDLIYFVDNFELYQKISALIGQNGKFECTLGDKDISVSVNTVGDGNAKNEVTSIVVLSDISVEKRVAREKSDFFANASHELKTPVTVVRGLSEVLLAEDNLGESATKKLTTLHKESLRLGSIIADMMELSSLEHAENTYEKNIEDVDLRAIAEDIRAELAENARAKNLVFNVEGAGTVKMSKKHALELVENLCSNAVNYNRENGSVNVKISQTPENVILTVADSGIGIEKQHIPRLCERFYRVDKSRSKKTGGTGLGLAIVKHICIANNASLKIESAVGKGTTVTVVFASQKL